MNRSHWIAGLTFTVALFIGATGAAAQVTPQLNAWTQVDTGDTNTTFYVGTTTEATTLRDVGVFVSNPDGLGVEMQVRLTCFANQYNSSQSGCSVTSALTTQTATVTGVGANVAYFYYATPVTLQANKVYVMEIIRASGSGTFDVYGDTVYQFNNQCNYAGLGVDCSGTPYFSFNTVPDWTGITATSTALTSFYQDGATSTLALIMERCAESSNVFSSAMCATVTFLFVPSPEILNNYVALPATVSTKFPFSWYYGIKDTYDGLTATTSTSSMIALGIDFASVDPATSTPFGPILPNATLLSAATVTTYLTPGILSTILLLESLAIWVLFSMYLFHDVQRRWFRH